MSAILLSIVVLLAAAGIAFVNQWSFGRLPRGERLERIRRSPNYHDGQFRNLHPTPQMTSGKGFAGSMWGILFGSKERREPASALPVLKPDLHRLERAEDALVWFGHSSYLLQLDGVRLLVDPVLTYKWPMSLFFSPFKGTDVFSPEDMPDIDCLIVTHDHWDHLDYRTVMQLKERIGRVVCPLGVGEHFEYWGFDSDRIVELDWNESCGLSDGFRIHCLRAIFQGAGCSATVRSGLRFWWRVLRGGSILQATAVTIRTSPRSAAGSRRSTWRWWRTGSTTPTGVTFI